MYYNARNTSGTVPEFWTWPNGMSNYDSVFFGISKSKITNSSISVLETGVFCEYVMSQYFSMGRENLEYKELHELIMQNLGENITSKVSERNSMIFGLDKKI